MSLNEPQPTQPTQPMHWPEPFSPTVVDSAPWAQTQYRYVPPGHPPEPPTPPPPPSTQPGGTGRTVWIASALAVAVVAVVTVVAVMHLTLSDSGSEAQPSPGSSRANRGSSGDKSSSTSVTQCGRPPQLSVTAARPDQNALALKLSITASCSTGDVLASSGTKIAVVTSGGINIASATFNLSANPIFVPRFDAGATEQVCLPADTLNQCFGSYSVQYSANGSTSTTSGSPGPSMSEHLKFRADFSNVRLMWSSEWHTFEPDWWVTATGVTYPTGQDALGWCREHGFDALHCYAKLVSNTLPVEGSTEHLPG
jgi:hypothetical protein